MSVQSSSCPMAETSGVLQAAAARTTPSSENPMRSSKAPPPRATMMTSTSGSASSWRIAAMMSGGHCAPCTCAWSTVKRTAGHRRFTLVITSPSARACGAQIRPMHRGNSGQWFFAVGVEQAFTLELLAQLVNLLFEPACADFADIVADEAQSGLLDPDVGASVDDHAVALAELRGRCRRRRSQPDTEMAMSSKSSRTVR